MAGEGGDVAGKPPYHGDLRCATNGRLTQPSTSLTDHLSFSYAAAPRKLLPKVFQGDTLSADTKRREHGPAMIDRLPFTVGFARVSQERPPIPADL